MSKPRVYVGQYGAFWQFSLDAWRALCAEASRTGSYDLDKAGGRRLKTKPRWLMKNHDCPGYTRLINEVLYYEPLDWTPEDFAREAEA